jgi:hypothetical protein
MKIYGKGFICAKKSILLKNKLFKQNKEQKEAKEITLCDVITLLM